jgi:hypothetical protein
VFICAICGDITEHAVVTHDFYLSGKIVFGRYKITFNHERVDIIQFTVVSPDYIRGYSQ